MPKRINSIILLFVICNLLFAQSAFAATPTPAKTIKLQSFTPVPTRTPTLTPIPSATQIPTPTRTPTVTLIPTSTPDPLLSQTPSPSPTNNPLISPTSTIIPTPTNPPAGETIAYAVIDLVNQIRNNCLAGYITFLNRSCINKLNFPPNVDTLVKWELDYSAYHQGWLQCVGLVRAAAARVNGHALNHGGNAIDFATNEPSGYIFIGKNNGVTIKVHDLPVWNYDTWGHIAYVIREHDQTQFEVAEANWGCSGCARFSVKQMADPHLIGWLRKTQ